MGVGSLQGQLPCVRQHTNHAQGVWCSASRHLTSIVSTPLWAMSPYAVPYMGKESVMFTLIVICSVMVVIGVVGIVIVGLIGEMEAEVVISSYDKVAKSIFESRKLNKNASRKIIQDYALRVMIDDMTKRPKAFRANVKKANPGISDYFINMLLQ